MVNAMIITLMGLGWVFLFLLTLIAAMKIMTWTCGKISPGPAGAGKGRIPDPQTLVKAKILAVLKARSLLP